MASLVPANESHLHYVDDWEDSDLELVQPRGDRPATLAPALRRLAVVGLGLVMLCAASAAAMRAAARGGPKRVRSAGTFQELDGLLDNVVHGVGSLLDGPPQVGTPSEAGALGQAGMPTQQAGTPLQSGQPPWPQGQPSQAIGGQQDQLEQPSIGQGLGQAVGQAIDGQGARAQQSVGQTVGQVVGQALGGQEAQPGQPSIGGAVGQAVGQAIGGQGVQLGQPSIRQAVGQTVEQAVE